DGSDSPSEWIATLRALAVAACRGHEEEVLVAPVDEGLRHLPSMDIVVACGSQDALTDAQDDALCDFVRRGGGLLCLGSAARAWHTSALLWNVPGVAVDGLTPATGLIVRVASDHDIPRRLYASFSLWESCNFLYETPEDADVLLQLSWRYSTVPVT